LQISSYWQEPLFSPNSLSHWAACVTTKSNRWMSSHESDRDVGVGKANDSGSSGDAFDLFMFYEHGNDRNAALKALGNAFTTSDGTTLSKANQRNYMQQAASDGVMGSAIAITSGAIPFSLNVFSLNGQSKEMRAKMLDDKFVLGRLAILGQSTAIFAKPNGGKTLLAIWLLIEQIKSGEIDGNDVYYINADDNHKGITQKLELAEQHGFIMLAPGYHGFKADQLSVYLDRLIQSDQARGKVIVLDTVKKFTDIMDKREGSKFGEAVRQFVAHGGTVIMLAHTNKHRDVDGKLVFSGTSDLVDDCDCAYLLDTISDDGSPKRVVEFENIKSRGDVASKSGYSFDSSDGKSYKQRLESVSPVDDKEREAAEHRRILDEQLERDKDAIHTIRECLIAQDKMQKTELIKAATERSAISKIKLTKALHRYTGGNKAEHQYWRVDVKDKNAHIYCLNWGGTEKQGHT
jgi:hypothetical protein